MIRIGILGYSDIARRKFIPALMKSSQAKLVAVASRQRSKAASCSANCTDAELMTYQALICSPAVDLIYISLPNHLHKEWSIRALEQGKHVICEKPLALSAASVDRMLEAAETNGVLLHENLMYLHHPQHRAVQALLASGRIGKIRSMRSEFVFPRPVSGDFRLRPDMGGGAYHDLNRYPLSAALYFLAGKTHHFLKGSKEIHAGLTESLEAESLTEEGEEFSFQTAFGEPYRSFYAITGDKGFIRVDRAFTTPEDMANRIDLLVGSRVESFFVPPADHFLNTIDHVCELIRSGHWQCEHRQTKKLAALADMYFANCQERGPTDDT